MDPLAVARWAHHRQRPSAWLHDEVGTRMASRLGWLRQPPLVWLDWEPIQGGLIAHGAVTASLPDAKVFIAAALSDQALLAIKKNNPASGGIWQRWRGKAPQPVQGSTRVDMVWANMALHAQHQPLALLRRWHSHLNTDGFLMFSCLGPQSLQELVAVYQRMGWAPPCHGFTDMHDWGDMLVQEGFAAPVMDAETITLTYASLDALVRDLRALGRNLHAMRDPRTHGRHWLARWRQAMEEHWPRTPQGDFVLTAEVIYGHAFKPRPRVRLSGTSTVSLGDMRSMLASEPHRRVP